MAVQGGKRNFGLDLLRAVAIVTVLVNHAYIGFFVWFHPGDWFEPFVTMSMMTFLSIEWLFVLSGFLIGTMMIRSFERGSSWWHRAKDFWLRRWFRTVPNYYLFLLINILATAWGIGQGVYKVEFAFFAQNLNWREATPLFYSESWSLALDEWFYLVMPILVGLFGWALRLKPQHNFTLVALTLILLPTLNRFLAPPPTSLWDFDERIRRVTTMHLDATGWGVLGAITSRWWPAFWTKHVRRKALLGLLLLLVGCLFVRSQFWAGFIADYPGLGRLLWYSPHFNTMIGLTLPAAGTFLALPWIASCKPRGGAVGWVVDRLSIYSYSIYLAHIPVMYVMRAAIKDTGEANNQWLLGAQALVWFVLSIAFAALVHHAFEKPVSDLRDRYTRKVDARPFQAESSPQSGG